MRLLLVDDDTSLLNLLNIFLTQKGHKVETAISGREGWEIVSQRNNDFDVVITDKTMPGGNGLILLGQIKEQFKEMPVILISGDFDNKTSDFPFDENQYFFFPKPFELWELETVLVQLYEKKFNLTQINSGFSGNTLTHFIVWHNVGLGGASWQQIWQ